MDDAQAPPAGTKGTVIFVGATGTIHVKWDNGSTLGIIPKVDSFKVINEQSRHICGSPYSENHCENLFYAQPGDEIGDKKLKAYSLYCLAGKRPRKISHMASWTGLTPKWCSKLST